MATKFSYDNCMDKIVYLTFDGPDKNTPYILDLLKKYNINATFFNLGIQEEKNPELVKRIVSEGHSLGNHTWSHDPAIYTNVSTFIQEVKKTFDFQKKLIDMEPDKIFRFPFGSNKATKESIKIIQDHGYNYIDWNVYLQDGSRNPSAQKAFELAINGVETCKDTPVILTHCEREDKTGPLEALEPIIVELKNRGYSFKRIKQTDKLIRLN